MPPLSANSRVLATGGGGFLGRHLVRELRSRFSVVSFDLQNPEGGNFFQGSVTDVGQIEAALNGIDGLVIGHMASRAPGVYDYPQIPFDINVKGTALLLDAAVRQGIKRVVLISSVAVVQKSLVAGEFLASDLPYGPDSIYGLTKVIQEQTAHYYHANHGLEIALLRAAYISLGDTLEDKYGRIRPSVNWQFIDPRDIGTAALAALTLKDLGCEALYLVAGPDAEKKADVAHTMSRLGWMPKYRFTEFPRD